MTGSSVFDYIHQEDHQELADQLGLTLSTGQPVSSPSSLGSEDGNNTSQGTMNPDGWFFTSLFYFSKNCIYSKYQFGNTDKVRAQCI